MRLQGLKLGLGVGLLLATGCGQLWRPFLEASSCDPSANCATEDLSVPTEPPMVVWSKQGPPNGLAADLYAVAAGADNEVMVGGDNGTFWRYKAGGAWSSPLAVNSKRVRSLYTHGQGQSWAAGDAATVQVWNGTGWVNTKATKRILTIPATSMINGVILVRVPNDDGSFYPTDQSPVVRSATSKDPA